MFMLGDASVREFIGGFKTDELSVLFSKALKWNNPTLAAVTQQELIRRGNESVVKDLLEKFFKSNKMRAGSVLAKMLSVNVINLEYDVFFKCFRRSVEESDPDYMISGKSLRALISAEQARINALCEYAEKKSVIDEESFLKIANISSKFSVHLYS